ncbi:hypothetical protein FI667_g10482, partial [Globisporangium splendens]
MEPQQLDAVLADWRDATEPLDGKSSVDPSFFTTSSSSSSSTWLLSSSSSSSSSAAAKASRALTRALEQRDERQCRPWSHEDFLARVSSFSIGTWFAKPESISVFATEGANEWLCEQYLCFKIDAKLSEKVRKASHLTKLFGTREVANVFAKLLITGHSPLCPWRENPSPVAFTTLPIASRAQVVESLVKRIEQLLAACSNDAQLWDALRKLQVETSVVRKILVLQVPTAALSGDKDNDACNESVVVDKLKASLVEKFGDLVRVGEEAVDVVLLHVVLLSSCGWRLEWKQEGGEDVGPSDAMWCEFCNRRWSVSSFASMPSPRCSNSNSDGADSGEVQDSSDPEAMEPSRKRQKLGTPDKTVAEAVKTAKANLLSQHRWFCPWVTARTQEDATATMDDNVAKFGENDATLWDFMRQPGWKQYATALHSLQEPSIEAADATAKPTNTKQDDAVAVHKASPKQSSNPEQALERVRAVLGLPDW